MNYDDFVECFGEPLKNKDGTVLFETYGEDLKRVQATNPNFVWTIIDEDGKLLIAPGFRLVNRVNYIIASRPRRGMDENIWFCYGDG